MNELTIAYITSRMDCRIEWFFESLAYELGAETKNPLLGVRVVVVDFHAGKPGRADQMARAFETVFGTGKAADYFVHTSPKPTVWQGPHRLTKVDYFAAANARNTALCFARDGWIAYVDDISILMPGWLECVEEARAARYFVLGAYKKVLDLEYGHGHAKYRPYAPGVDTRWMHGSPDKAVPCTGSWFYGCSVAGPVEGFLEVNGWDEDADCCGMGGEDYTCGLMLERAGYQLRYDRRMLTLESEELHHVEVPLKRVIEKEPNRLDASLVFLEMVKGGRNKAPNYFPPGGIQAERARVLAGAPFTVQRIPENSWYSGKRLADL